MFDKFITGAVIALIFIGTPFLYKLGKKKKAESIQKGKVYYGLFWCRILLFFIAGIISAEMILMLLLGDSIEGYIALIIMFLCSLPFAALYIFLYKKHFEKKYLNKEQD